MHHPVQLPEPKPPYSLLERRGSAVAHGSALLLGVPLLLLQLLPLPLAFLGNPVIAYLIARSFRRRHMAWGAYQGMQAAVIHFAMVVILFLPVIFAGEGHYLPMMSFTAALLLFLYSLWGAWDTLLGYDFKYIGISSLLHRVSQANLKRMEQDRGFFQPYRTERDEQRRD
jgi:hypothetical protein